MLERNGWMHIINSEYYDKSCVDWYAGRKRVAHELGLNSHISHSVSYPTQSRLKAGFLLFWSFINTPVCNFLMAWLRILEGNEYFYLFLSGSFKNTELIEVTHACNPYPPTLPPPLTMTFQMFICQRWLRSMPEVFMPWVEAGLAACIKRTYSGPFLKCFIKATTYNEHSPVQLWYCSLILTCILSLHVLCFQTYQNENKCLKCMIY